MKINIDKEGKIAIPKKIRKNLGIHPGDSFHIEVTEKSILITPFREERKVDTESVIVLSGTQEETARIFTLK
ncbi:MAG: AbrB/MazE/SpoVT family DNA-binding domain-containing protein [Spirochaetales bacterium]|nr:AbrB/MazE/SpoVT family DNA-binding domain-containing protein [Spirochaetales bacterium]